MCNNYEYKQNIIRESDKIWIDTCTLMYNDRMTSFIRETKNIFKSLRKKITIHGMVMSELYKFSDCDNFAKKELADNAISLINNNREIFEIDYSLTNVSDHDRKKEIFADPKLLIELLSNRRSENQLLISNDQGLTSDAFKLNSFTSFDGGRINVCYLNQFGEMHMCQCAKATLESVPKEKIVYQDRIVEKVIERDQSFLEKHGLETGLFTGAALTILACKWKFIFKTIKSYV